MCTCTDWAPYKSNIIVQDREQQIRAGDGQRNSNSAQQRVSEASSRILHVHCLPGKGGGGVGGCGCWLKRSYMLRCSRARSRWIVIHLRFGASFVVAVGVDFFVGFAL